MFAYDKGSFGRLSTDLGFLFYVIGLLSSGYGLAVHYHKVFNRIGGICHYNAADYFNLPEHFDLIFWLS